MSAALLFFFYASFRFCGPQLPVLFQQRLEVLAGKAAGHLGHLLRRTLGNHQTAGAAAFRAKVNDVVRTLDEIQVVLDDNDCVARIHQLLQHLDQAMHVRDVQAGGSSQSKSFVLSLGKYD